MTQKRIFDNTQIAFALKNKTQLNTAYRLFKLMANGNLVKIGANLTKFAFKIGLPIKPIVKQTVFNQFCGGETKNDCLEVINNMYQAGASSILDYSVEGKATEADFDAAMQKKIELVAFAKAKNEIPFVVMKPTALGRFALWEKVTLKQTLAKAEEDEWQRIINRFNAICEATYKADLKILIDAEETWMQDAADDLCEAMMKRYNKEHVVVYNTLQCYRWDRVGYLKALHERAKKEKFKVGMKIVRGAYMEKERMRANNMAYKSPICKDKNETDTTFNTALEYIIHNLNDIGLFVATHNEDSNYLAIKYMENLKIANTDNAVWFGQLYGMSDHITFNLAKHGYNAAKLIPFGPVKEVIPYLIRRAQENTSVAGQTGRELALLAKEKARRAKS